MKRLIPCLLVFFLCGCPQQGGSSKTGDAAKSDAPSDVVGEAKSTAGNAAEGAGESLKTAPGRAADDAGRAVSGQGKNLSEAPEKAERAAEGAKSTAKKATKKASGLLDKAFDRD